MEGSTFHQKQATFPEHETVELRELVRNYKVCWKVWPEYHIDRKGEKIQIGFELDLIGTHFQPEHIPEPGCAECVTVYDNLKKIAQWIIPKDERDSCYEIGIFDNAIRYASQRKSRADIVVPIKILHREGFDRPTDACEVRCLGEMEEKLKELAHKRGIGKRLANSGELIL